MRIALRSLVLLLVFVGVGWFTARHVETRAVAGTPAAEVRLASAMAGLFAGGAAVVVVGIALLWKRGGQA
jgi:hypothetical protein